MISRAAARLRRYSQVPAFHAARLEKSHFGVSLLPLTAPRNHSGNLPAFRRWLGVSEMARRFGDGSALRRWLGAEEMACPRAERYAPQRATHAPNLHGAPISRSQSSRSPNLPVKSRLAKCRADPATGRRPARRVRPARSGRRWREARLSRPFEAHAAALNQRKRRRARCT